MRWLALSLLGPGVWAFGFALVYALHGTGCARGWPETALAGGLDLHRAVLAAGALATIAVGGAVLAGLRRQHETEGSIAARLPLAGAWTGLGASLVTLSPVALATSC